MALAVRSASPADAATMAELINAAFAQYRGTLVPPSGALRETADSVAALLAGGGGAMAALDGAPAGAVLFRPNGEDLYLGRLSTLPQLRGRGVGEALVGFVEAEARRRGCPAVVLSVRLQLPANRRFFQRLGFVKVSESAHEGFDRPTTAGMRKELAR